MTDPQKAAGMAVTALGAAQLLATQTTARAFGLGALDAQSVWLARLLGATNIGLGLVAVDERSRQAAQSATRIVLAANAAATVLGARSGAISKRTAALVLAFVGAVAAAEVAGD